MAPRLPPSAQRLHLIDPTVSRRLREGEAWARTKAATLGPEDGSRSQICHPLLPPPPLYMAEPQSGSVILGSKSHRDGKPPAKFESNAIEPSPLPTL